MQRKIKFTPTADGQLTALENAPSKAALLGQVRKAIGCLEIDPHHPGLQTHEFSSLMGVNGEKVFEAYAQNNTSGAYRIFWHYGPDEIKGKKRTPAITIVAITPHPYGGRAPRFSDARPGAPGAARAISEAFDFN